MKSLKWLWFVLGGIALLALGFAIGWMVEDNVARLSLMGDEQALAVFGEQHEVGFPMACRGAIGDINGSFAEQPDTGID